MRAFVKIVTSDELANVCPLHNLIKKMALEQNVNDKLFDVDTIPKGGSYICMSRKPLTMSPLKELPK